MNKRRFDHRRPKGGSGGRPPQDGPRQPFHPGQNPKGNRPGGQGQGGSNQNFGNRQGQGQNRRFNDRPGQNRPGGQGQGGFGQQRPGGAPRHPGQGGRGQDQGFPRQGQNRPGGHGQGRRPDDFNRPRHPGQGGGQGPRGPKPNFGDRRNQGGPSAGGFGGKHPGQGGRGQDQRFPRQGQNRPGGQGQGRRPDDFNRPRHPGPSGGQGQGGQRPGGFGGKRSDQGQRGPDRGFGNRPGPGGQPGGFSPRSGGGKGHRKGGRDFMPRGGAPARPVPGGQPGGAGKAPLFAEGTLIVKGKFGFVLSETPGLTDVYVQGETLRLAMSGDRVKVRLRPGSGGERREGEVVEVLKRARNKVVGLYKNVRGKPLLQPETSPEPVRLTDLGGLSPKEDDFVVAEILTWPSSSEWASARLREVLGPRSTPGVDLQVLVRKHDLPSGFPPEVEAEAKSFGDSVPDEALKGRTTFFDQPVFTIDGADAKDFDDAVSLEERPGGGWRLGVHIADVAHYVREGTPLDEEAYRRSTSVYLVGTVIPMLPFPLSDNLCSLRPDVVRLTLSCLMDIDARGAVESTKIVQSAIRSVRRFTYDEVEEILEGGGPPVTPDVRAALLRMGELAKLLRRLRFERGSLDFDFPEPYVVTDNTGWPVDIRVHDRGESHRLIEQFMLLANESVAQAMSKGPFIYRIHERPDPQKMAKLEETLKAVGVPVPAGFHEGHPSALQKVLESAKGKPVESMVHKTVLRSLKQAVYSERNAGHFGLASKCYTHFTSPIRRYPDLIVHRVVKESLGGALTPERQARWAKDIPTAAVWTSQRERVAVDAEREYLDLKRVQFMEKYVGEEFDGVISGVTAFGFFVQLTKIFVEGLVHVTNLKGDYYAFDEVRGTLRGRRTGVTYRMGMPVRVLLAAANVPKRQLDLQVIDAKAVRPV